MTDIATATTRYRPTRYGIVGLYEYHDQVFEAEGGRLALRGRNTSGKSKALELLMPFAIDGDIHPRKLDPFASDAKSMRWNLIECTDRHPEHKAAKRIGYVWAEFSRPGPDGTLELFTCGIGLEAVRGGQGVKDRWYFITTQRIGDELELIKSGRHGDQPVVKSDLAAALAAGGGKLFTTQADYKAAIRERLLPFPSERHYERHLEVIRSLRKPKLSDKLNDRTLAELLNSTLPAVDDTLMRKLGDSLERLDHLQAELGRMQAARDLVDSVARRELHSYARGLVIERGGALRRAETGYENARSALRRALDDVEAAEARLQALADDVERVEGESARARAKHERLLTSDAYKSIAALEDAVRNRERAASRLADDQKLVEQAESRAKAAQGEHEQASARADKALDQLSGLAQGLRAAADRAGMPFSGQVDEQALRGLGQRLTLRTEQLTEARRLHSELRRQRERLALLRDELERAQQDVELKQDRLAAASEGLDAAREQVAAELVDWREREIVALEISDGDEAELREALMDAEDARRLLDEIARPQRERVLTERAGLTAADGRLHDEQDDLQAQIDELQASPLPQALPGSPLRRSRDGRPGAPLWLVCDFGEELPADQRGALEAALMEAGMLDAWISPDGTLHDGDATLVPAPADGPTLAGWLQAAPGDTGMDAALVEAVLRSIPRDGRLSVAPGRFQVGPLHGRFAQPQPELIGAAAREAHRQAQIAALRGELDALADRRAQLRAQSDQLDQQLQRIAAEQQALPDGAAVRSALRASRVCEDELQRAEAARAAVVTRREAVDGEVAEAREAVDEHARATGLPSEESELDSVERAMQTLRADAGDVRRALDSCAHLSDAAAGAKTRLAEAEQAVEQARARAALAGTQLAEAQGELDAVEAAQSARGISADALRAEAQELSARVQALDAERRQVTKQHMEAGIEVERRRSAVESGRSRESEAELERTQALEAFRALGANDMFSAALGEDAPDDEREASAWTLTVALDRLRAMAVGTEQVNLRSRLAALEDRVRDLNLRLRPFDMDVTTRSTDGMTVVYLSAGGAPLSVPAMEQHLDEELAHREKLMTEQRAKVFSDALLSEIAGHLQSRVQEVRNSVAQRNATLKNCLTGAGRRVEMRWERALDSDAERDVLKLLEGGAVELLEDREREQLFEFFRTRLDSARVEIAQSGTAAEASDYLARAFDYRQWWTFTLWVHEPGASGAQRLTAKTQGVGSGGEQSVLLHLPLFATAASMYDLVPGAPRIIALDEAMDGIDDPTREDMFKVLVDLDLDLFLTAYDIDPCVATVPEVGFYELHRDNAEWGVYAEHFRWNGTTKVAVIDE
jgi:uncharacterized protein (TIGR02680 family)